MSRNVLAEWRRIRHDEAHAEQRESLLTGLLARLAAADASAEPRRYVGVAKHATRLHDIATLAF